MTEGQLQCYGETEYTEWTPLTARPLRRSAISGTDDHKLDAKQPGLKHLEGARDSGQCHGGVDAYSASRTVGNPKLSLAGGRRTLLPRLLFFERLVVLSRPRTERSPTDYHSL